MWFFNYFFGVLWMRKIFSFIPNKKWDGEKGIVWRKKLMCCCACMCDDDVVGWKDNSFIPKTNGMEKKKGILLLETFTYGWLLFLYCWMRRTVFSSQRTMGWRKNIRLKNLSICVIVVGLGNIVGCKLLDEN